MEFTGISERWMRELTEGLTNFMNEMRDLAIELEAGEGRSQRQISDATGVPQKTVSRSLESKRPVAETTQVGPKPSLFERLSQPQDIRSYCRTDSPEESSLSLTVESEDCRKNLTETKPAPTPSL